MSRISVFAVLILTLVPAALRAQPTDTEFAKVSAEQRQAAAAIQQLHALETDAIRLLQDAIRQSQGAADLQQRHASKSEVEHWLGGWRPGLESREKELRARAAQLRPWRSEDYPLIIKFAEADANAFIQTPNKARDLIESTLDMADQVMALDAKAAAGNKADWLRLVALGGSAGAAVFKMENETTAASLPLFAKDQPQHAFGLTTIDTNTAYIALLEAKTQLAIEGTLDRKAFADRIRQAVTSGRKNAQYTIDRSDYAIMVLSKDPRATGEYGRRMLASYENYKESARLEIRILDTFAPVADRAQSAKDLAFIDDILPTLTAMGRERAQLSRQGVSSVTN